MEARVLNDITIIKSPKTLPSDKSHKESIDSLAANNCLVILLSFGDEKYDVPETYQMPLNVRSVHYDYESMDESLDSVQQCLEGFGVGLVSRHKNQTAPLPFLLTGSILTLPEGTKLNIPDSASNTNSSKKSNKRWDIL